MEHQTFLRNILLVIAVTLGTADFIIMSDFNSVSLIATSAIILVGSLAAIYFFAAGGYHISKDQIQDTIKGMRG